MNDCFLLMYLFFWTKTEKLSVLLKKKNNDKIKVYSKLNKYTKKNLKKKKYHDSSTKKRLHYYEN